MQSHEQALQKFKETINVLEGRRSDVMSRIFEKFRFKRLNLLRADILNRKDKTHDK